MIKTRPGFEKISEDSTEFAVHTHDDDEYDKDGRTKVGTGKVTCGVCGWDKFEIVIPPMEYSVMARCTNCGHNAEIYSG